MYRWSRRLRVELSASHHHHHHQEMCELKALSPLKINAISFFSRGASHKANNDNDFYCFISCVLGEEEEEEGGKKHIFPHLNEQKIHWASDWLISCSFFFISGLSWLNFWNFSVCGDHRAAEIICKRCPRGCTAISKNCLSLSQASLGLAVRQGRFPALQ